MTIEYRLPELGEDIETGDIISINVSVGDTVSEDEPLMEIETDKAAIEIPSPAGGVIKELHVKEGETIEVGQLLITIDDDAVKGKGAKAATVAAGEEKVEEPEPKKDKRNEDKQNKEEETPELVFQEQKGNGRDDDAEITPVAEKDKKAERTKELREGGEASAAKEAAPHPPPASPSVRRFARERGIDINTVTGSGPGGRISEADVKSASGGGVKKAKEPVAETAAPLKDTPKKSGAPVSNKRGEEERVKMSRVRRLTAERLTEAWKAPHVTQYDKADITELEKLRKQYGKSVEEAGGKLTMTSILIKTITRTLKEFPELNASVDMERSEIIYKYCYNIGVAVDTERGLLVPVIKDADKKNLTELSVELTGLSERAREKKITPDELKGGTFTISNLGALGGTYFSPVLNAPQVGILGVSRASLEPVYVEGELVPRLMLPLSLSYDHRLVDGAVAVRFLRRLIEELEKPQGWLLKVD